MAHQWDPGQYEKFERERHQPFFDLMHLIQPLHHPKIVDLGCGDGRLTKILHEKLNASYTLGIDSSKEMLAKAHFFQIANLNFEERSIQTLNFDHTFDLVISNAAFQWVPDHPTSMQRLEGLLSPGGQLAIQMPANQDFLTHVIAAELASEEPFRQAVYPFYPLHHLLSMEDYAQLFEKMGFENQVIRLQLYTHFLESTASVVEWMRGSLLTYYKSYLSPDLYEKFLKEYQKRLIERLGWSEPFFFPLKRLFLWGQLPLQ